MKNFSVFISILLFSLFLFPQEKQEQNLKIVGIKYAYGFWIGFDKENSTFKIKKEDDQIIELKYVKNMTKLLGKEKRMKIANLKEGDYVKVFYKEKEGVNVATRIVKDPPKPQNTTSSPSGD